MRPSPEFALNAFLLLGPDRSIRKLVGKLAEQGVVVPRSTLHRWLKKEGAGEAAAAFDQMRTLAREVARGGVEITKLAAVAARSKDASKSIDDLWRAVSQVVSKLQQLMERHEIASVDHVVLWAETCAAVALGAAHARVILAALSHPSMSKKAAAPSNDTVPPVRA